MKRTAKLKRSGFQRPTHEEAVTKAREWQERQRAKVAAKTRETGSKRQKSSIKKRSKKTIENKPLEDEFKRVCRERDGSQCRWIDEWEGRCLYRDDHIPVHHINERSQRPDEKHNPDNGACLCPLHHDRMHHTIKGRARGKELGLLGGESYELAKKKERQTESASAEAEMPSVLE